MSVLGVADRVQEQSVTTGVGTITLTGAIAGYRTFGAALGAGSACSYVIQLGSAWEAGVGLLTTASSVFYLSRETVLSSSNSNAAVSFAAGTKQVFISWLAEMQDAVLMVAVENVSVRDAVCLNDDNSTSSNPLGVMKTDASRPEKSTASTFIGFCLHAALAGKPVLVKTRGPLTGFASLTPLGYVYLSADTPGGITQVIVPANAKVVGRALWNGTDMFIDTGIPDWVVAEAGTSGSFGFLGPGTVSIGQSGSFAAFDRGYNCDYLDPNTLVGNAASRGLVSVGVSAYATVGSGSGPNKIYMCGGASGISPIALESTIQSGTRFTTTGNLSDVGDLSQARCGISGAGNGTRGFLAGGLASGGQSNVIDMLTHATFTTSTTDIGDLLVARSYLAAAAKGSGAIATTDVYFAGGYNTVHQAQIDKLNVNTTTQNGVDRGDLSERKQALAGLGADIVVFAGGFTNDGYSSVVESLDSFSTSSTAMNRGELTLARAGLGACPGLSSGALAGGRHGVETALIEHIDLLTLSINISNRGELSYARTGLSGH
jgi:hypothetical protein